MEMVEQVEIAF